jgi:hypothetical protein
MSDLTRATGQPVTVTIGGRELTLSPITIGDIAAFEKFAKERRLQTFLDMAKAAGMDKDEKLEGITRILTIPFTQNDFMNEMNSTTGVKFLLWRSISKKHPKFTLDQVDDLSDMEELMAAINAISNLGRLAENPPEQVLANDLTGTESSPE